MRAKASLILLLFSIVCNLCRAQSWTEVKQSGAYYFGEGWGATVEEANQQALSMLIQQIRVNVSLETGQRGHWQQKDGVVTDNSFFQSSLATYSQATLDGTQMLVIDPAPKAHVGRWIKKSELDKIFQSRRIKVHELLESAARAIEKGKVDVALRSYCWAFNLVKSMQRCNEEQYEGHTLMTWIPERMDDILDNVKASVVSSSGGNVELLFTYGGKPVNSLDFTYNDGGFWSNICSAKDGLASIWLSPGSLADDIAIEIEYEYRGQSMLDPEIQSVMEVIPETPLRKALLSVKNAEPESAEAPLPSGSFTCLEENIFSKPEPMVAESVKYDDILAQVLDAVSRKDFGSVRHLFTEEGFAIFNRLVNYGSARIVGIPEFSFNRVNGEVCGRGLRMSFSFRGGARKSFTEDIVFSFNADNLVSNIAFGLGKTTEDDILGNSNYPEAVRWQLVQFMENYQTAFALKRIDYLRTIFDDDAIIIVGKEVARRGSPGAEHPVIGQNKIIEYNRYSKDEYLKRLARSFASKEYINLRFNSTNVRRALNGGEIYGIQIEQDYYSSNYGDHGYLFLEINMNDIEHPTILVRTWQPQPDPDFGVYGIADFPIQRFD